MEFNEFADLIHDARSTRRFRESDPVPSDVLVKLIDLARVAPSSANKQPLRYVAVSAPDLRDAIFPALRWAGAMPLWDGPEPGEQPTGYILMLSEGPAPQTDVGIAGMTLQLGATAHGYAACMLGNIDRPEILKRLGLSPATWVLHLVIAIGRPGETIVTDSVGPESDLKYYRDADGVHHVPKLRLGEVQIELPANPKE